MALNVNTPFGFGTISSASGTTMTLASGAATADWVGRGIKLSASIADRGGQWRKIVSVTSATEIEIEYPWRTELDSADPDFEYLPQSGDAYHISLAFDDIDDGVNVNKLSDVAYEVLDTLVLDGNAWIFDELKTIDFTDRFGSFRVTTNAAFILGNYNSDGLGVNGCLIIGDKPASGFVSVITSNSSGAGGGDFALHGCIVDFSTGAGSGSYFVRTYRGDNHRARLINCSTFGVFGGRYQGIRSLIKDVISTQNQSVIGPFTTKSPMTVEGYTVSDSLQAAYWNGSFSGSGKIVRLKAINISSYIIRFGGTNVSLDMVSWDISEANKGDNPGLILWDSANGSTGYWSSVLSFFANSGGGRIAVFNAANEEQINELSTDGTYQDTEVRARQYDGQSGGIVTFDSGTVLGPFRVELRQYGKEFLQRTLTADTDESLTWRKTDNTLITAADAATALATTNPSTADASYDHSQATYELSGNMQYEEKITAAGVTLTFDLGVTLDSGLSAVAYDLANDAVSYSALGNGAKLSTIALGENQTLTLAVAETYTGNWQIPATGTVELVAGTYDLSAFTFTAGATLNLSSGTATVTVLSDPGIVTTGAGTINIVEPQPVLTITNFPDNSTVTLSQLGFTLITLNNTDSPFTYQTLANQANEYQVKVEASGFEDYFVTLSKTSTTAVWAATEEGSGQAVDDNKQVFMKLMSENEAFIRIANNDPYLVQQRWLDPGWTANWANAVIGDAPSTAEIAGWASLLTLTGWSGISFDANTGEVN